jgi:WD40 repeat protein
MSTPGESRAALPSAEWARVGELVERFEDAWGRGERPALEDYLPPGGSERRAALRELAHTELEYRLKGGEAAGAEEYLGRFAELADDPTAALGLIAAEDRLLRQLGRGRPPEEYLRRFPRYRDELAARLLLTATAGASHGDSHPAPFPAGATVRVGPPTGPDSGPRYPAVPGYEVVKELGRGGMGVVYLARQTSLGRLVALKMIRAGAGADPEEMERFRFEAEAVARLQHPNVVQVHEVGAHGGLPYFSLEYVEGGSLAQRLAGTPMEARAAAELVEVLARAVGAAHDRGILHRDLKPANVLLTADGQPKVTDFGLAKRLDGDMGRTQTGAVLGTPSYMAPEQADGRAREVGPACDVYALGAVLYECLTGRPPFRAASLRETLEQVCTRDPAAPRDLNPAVPRDLETICLKALAKEPARRYPSAAALADDLRRFLRGEPIAARRVGPTERLLLWARRRPAVAAVCALGPLLAVLGPGAVVVTGLWQRAEHERGVAQQARDDLRAARDDLQGAKDRLEVVLTSEQTAKGKAEELARELRLSRYFRNVDLAHREWQADHWARADQLLAECPEDLRGWEWHYVHRLCHADRLTWPAHTGGVNALAFNPDGKLLASGGEDHVIKLWDVATGREVRTLRGHTQRILALAFSPDGRHLASGSVNDGAFLWEVASGKQVRVFGGGGDRLFVSRLAFSPDGQHLAGATDGPAEKGAVTLLGGPPSVERLLIWDVTTGRPTVFFTDRSIGTRQLVYDHEGSRLAAALTDKVVVWDAATGKELFARKKEVAEPGVTCVAFSPDGKELAAAVEDGQVRLWDLAAARELVALKVHNRHCGGLAYAPDGRLATFSEDGSVRVRNPHTIDEPLIFRGHTDFVTAAAWGPDGKRLASASKDGTIKLWDPGQDPGGFFLRDTWQWSGGQPIFSPDSRRLVVGDVVWDLPGRKVLRSPRDPAWHGPDGKTGIRWASFTADGRRFAGTYPGGMSRVWSTETWQPILDFSTPDVGYSRVFSPDGRRLYVGILGGVKVYDAETGKELRLISRPKLTITSMAVSPDSRWLATGEQSVQGNGPTRLWDADSGRQEREFDDAGNLTFSPDGKLLGISGLDGVKLWDVATGRHVRTLHGYRPRLGVVAFSPDGRRLVGNGGDALQLWDVETGQECLTLQGPGGRGGRVGNPCFSPDGRLLASYFGQLLGPEGIKLWDGTPAP